LSGRTRETRAKGGLSEKKSGSENEGLMKKKRRDTKGIDCDKKERQKRGSVEGCKKPCWAEKSGRENEHGQRNHCVCKVKEGKKKERGSDSEQGIKEDGYSGETSLQLTDQGVGK